MAGGARYAIVVGAPPVEWYANGAALAARANKARAEDVLNCAADEPIVDDVARTLAVELARPVNALDPEMVITGGGLGLARAFQLRLIALGARAHYTAETRRPSIVGAALGRDVGVVGAAPAGDEVASRRVRSAGPRLSSSRRGWR